jgi:microcystin degradation protein MlrC
VKAQEKAFAGELLDPDAAALRAIALSKKAKKPIVLADVQDNPGAGGTSDTVGLLAALMRHKARGAVIGMIVDEGAARAAVETGEGNVMRRGIGAVVGYAGETPVVADWRVVKVGDGKFTGTGPFYGGARFQIGPMALVTDEASGVSAVLACKRIQAADQEMFRHVGVEPSKVPILGLKSTVHFRADFQPIAETILVVQSPGAHITDPVEMPYKHLRKGMKLRPMGPRWNGAPA